MPLRPKLEVTSFFKWLHLSDWKICKDYQINTLILTFVFTNIFLEAQRNSMNAVTIARAIPRTKTRNAPLTFAKLNDFADLGAFLFA